MADIYALEMIDISKAFDGTQVLRNINLKVKAGQIHCLVGENGAGKSTLMNVLFSMPVIEATGGYEGQVKIDGKIVNFKSPREAIDAGVGMVHQEFMLLPGFSVTENIKLNRENLKKNIFSRLINSKLATLDRKTMGQEARHALDRLGMNIDEWMPVAGLPVGYMQFIEIAREIDKKNIKILIFDEPTAVLTESESMKFLEIVKSLAAEGIGILFISHRLSEIMELADEVTVLKDGELVDCMPREACEIEQIAAMMVGREVEAMEIPGRPQGKLATEKPVLEIRDLWVDMPGEKVRGLNLDIYKGEILGLGGLAGHGKVGVANGIMGLYQASGEVFYDGESLPLNEPAVPIKRGLAFLSEDRRGVGLALDDSIENNIVITSMQMQDRFLKWSFLNFRDGAAVRQNALQMIDELDIRCTGPTQLVRRLSGGNQQKVCLARAFTLNPSFLFVSEPTRGIDVGAKK